MRWKEKRWPYLATTPIPLMSRCTNSKMFWRFKATRLQRHKSNACQVWSCRLQQSTQRARAVASGTTNLGACCILSLSSQHADLLPLMDELVLLFVVVCCSRAQETEPGQPPAAAAPNATLAAAAAQAESRLQTAATKLASITRTLAQIKEVGFLPFSVLVSCQPTPPTHAHPRHVPPTHSPLQ